MVSTVIRSNKKQQREEKEADKNRSKMMEKFYSEASDKVEREQQKTPRKKYKRRKLCDIEDGEELLNYLEDSNDGASFEVSVWHPQFVFRS